MENKDDDDDACQHRKITNLNVIYGRPNFLPSVFLLLHFTHNLFIGTKQKCAFPIACHFTYSQESVYCQLSCAIGKSFSSNSYTKVTENTIRK